MDSIYVIVYDILNLIRKNNGKLAALVTTCASKGWTISGLTLE